MRLFRIAAIGVVLLASIAFAYAQPYPWQRIGGKVLYADSTRSSIRLIKPEDGVPFPEITTQSYPTMRTDSGYYIISQRTIWQQGHFEGKLPRLIASCKFVPTGAEPRTLWTLDDSVDEGSIDETMDMYRTEWHGCCGARNTTTFYNLTNGTELGTSTEKLILVRGGSEGADGLRIIAFESIDGRVSELQRGFNADSMCLGALFYFDNDSLFSKIILHLRKGSGSAYFVPMTIEAIPNPNMELSDYNDYVGLHLKKSFSKADLQIKLSFMGLHNDDSDSVETVIIPVGQGGFTPTVLKTKYLELTLAK